MIDWALFASILIIILLLYFLATETNKVPGKENIEKVEKEKPKKFILIKNNHGLYLCINPMTRYIYLSDNKDEAETFLLEYLEKPIKTNDNNDPEIKKYFKNKITLRTTDGYYIGLKYTTHPKDIYDVSVESNSKNNSTLLTIKKTKKTGKYFHAKFYNGHFINVNEHNYLNSTKIPQDVFLFEMKTKYLKT